MAVPPAWGGGQTQTRFLQLTSFLNHARKELRIRHSIKIAIIIHAHAVKCNFPYMDSDPLL